MSSSSQNKALDEYYIFILENFISCDLGCVWESLYIIYLSLSFQISTFNKNYRCWKQFIKIA